jgi:hypothetical protein
MHPDISEFSYGYALTETLISIAPVSVRAAPVFPSLIEEGKSGGYDVHIPFAGFPLFLQFKLSHRMVRDSAFEVQKGILKTPFYRMHLRPMRHSQQHPLLLKLESTGAAVYYAAPQFHSPSELNDAYAAKQVAQRSIFIKPSEIGTLPDDDDHHIAFRSGFASYLCSDNPRLLREAGAERNSLIEELRTGSLRRPRIEPSAESSRDWADRLMTIVRSEKKAVPWLTDRRVANLYERNPLSLFAYLARTFFDCQVVVIGADENHD